LTNKLKNVLVTGATGYIGSNLVRYLLSNNYYVFALKLPNTQLPKSILGNNNITIYDYNGKLDSISDAFLGNNIELVFHLASFVIGGHRQSDIDNLINSNILFGTQLLEVMRNNNVKNIINTGTYWQHYNNELYNPVCLYAATKKSFEDILYYYHQCCDFNILTLELYDNYGPNDNRGKLFYWLKKSLSCPEPILLTSGEQRLSYVFIDDIIDAYIVAENYILGKNIFSNFAVRHNESFTIQEIVKIYQKIIGKKLNVVFGGREYNDREVMEPYDVIPLLPGWIPKCSMDEGLRKTLV
jgi:nucleoside-diphosphate-sugar epimerase